MLNTSIMIACATLVTRIYNASPFGLRYVREIIPEPMAYVNKRKSPLKRIEPVVNIVTSMIGVRNARTSFFKELLSRITYETIMAILSIIRMIVIFSSKNNPVYVDTRIVYTSKTAKIYGADWFLSDPAKIFSFIK